MVQAADKPCTQASDCISFCGPKLLPTCLDYVCVCVNAPNKFARTMMNKK